MTGRPFRTFVIADLRGYTRYSGRFGDDAAASVATRFAQVALDVARDTGGQLVEVRGDEVLLAYTSARTAIEAAIELQRRSRGEDGVALPVGSGIDAGEPVVVGEGYRGAALNLAARLCSIAAPGQILASDTTVSLAGHMDAVTVQELRSVRLKGVERTVRHYSIEPVEPLPPVPAIPEGRRRGPPKPPRRLGRRSVAAAAAGLVLAVGVAAVAYSSRGSGAGANPGIEANALIAIDPDTFEVVHRVPIDLGTDAVSLAAGDGSLWTYNDQQTVFELDAATGERLRTIGVGVPPSDIAVGGGRVWIAAPSTGEVLQLNPLESTPSRIKLGLRTDAQLRYLAYALAWTPEKLWVAAGLSNGLLWIDTLTDAVHRPRDPALRLESFYEVSATSTSVWVGENVDATAVTEMSPEDGRVVGGPLTLARTIRLLGPQDDLAADDTGIWYVSAAHNRAYHIDPGEPLSLRQAIPVGRAPTGIALDRSGRAWAANSGSGTVSVIDPVSDTVIRTIRLGHNPNAVAYGGGYIWVTLQEL
jgi:adenylate cyclase